MAKLDDKLAQLQTRLEHLERYEEAFTREIGSIRREIESLRTQPKAQPEPPVESEVESPPYQKAASKAASAEEQPSEPKSEPQRSEETETPESAEPIFTQETFTEQAQNNLEKFIGENLISKIGIVILIIGVGIGAKYAIDNNLISPLMRIVFGYLVGFVLIGLALRLKPKYTNYSAVLMSGGMAIMYFITYFAYSYYSLLSQTSAFGLMAIFTIFTVLASILYDRQVIAHIGLVGAYAVPFLLSEDSGRFVVLFTYIAIINFGILAVSVKKYWKPLLFSSFFFTWLIFAGWFFDRFDHSRDLIWTFVFITIYFLTFYLSFVTYKLVHKESFKIDNFILILINSVLFYGFGADALSRGAWTDLQGSWAMSNALIHFGFAYVIQTIRTKDWAVFHLIVSLVLAFLLLAVPIQFAGHTLTLLLMAYSVALFSIGRTKRIPLFEYFSYPTLFFAASALFVQWLRAFDRYPADLESAIYPIFNKDFVTSISVAVGFGIVYLVNRKGKRDAPVEESEYRFMAYIFGGVFLLVLYNTFRIEIGNYFAYQELATELPPAEPSRYFTQALRDPSLSLFSSIWQINYSMLFLSVLAFVNVSRIRGTVLGYINLALNSFLLFIFLTSGLVILAILGDQFTRPDTYIGFEFGPFHILIRYISYGFLAGLFYASFKYLEQEFVSRIVPTRVLKVLYELALAGSVLAILSSELILWSSIFGVGDIYKLGLSILFAVYALLLIIWGIFKKRSHLRYFAFVLIAITLSKLFLYDLAELGTISKTVVFVSVGTMLLIASYIYTKYTAFIFDE
ncbi:MAG: DUF2339 domain-containing protein [Pyrinomonadaceae bacterium]|nr:DUF2339 domain-containing protein [Pyrinomonadaceae bacterium]